MYSFKAEWSIAFKKNAFLSLMINFVLLNSADPDDIPYYEGLDGVI